MSVREEEMREDSPEQYRNADTALFGEADEPYLSGFNLKTIWACLFVGFVMLPGSIYLSLVTGGQTGAADWVTVILFLEIAKRSLVKMTRQEIMILYWAAAGLAAAGNAMNTGITGGPFAHLIWEQYYLQSPEATGIATLIPTWVVPTLDSGALASRTFFHMDWFVPVLVLTAVTVLFAVNSYSMGYILFRVTNDVERLTFPLARVHAGGATALAETSQNREGWRWRAFSIGSVIGVSWGLLYVMIPILSSTFLVTPITILPIPFIDFTTSLKEVLPATMVGIGTDLGTLVAGFVLPFWVVIGTFVSSAVIALIANPLLYHNGILTTWEPGMSLIPTQISNNIDFWLSFTIGASLVIGIVGFTATIRAILKSNREKRNEPDGDTGVRPTPEGRGDLPIWLVFIFWFVSTTGFVVILYFLIPDFPWWISAIFGYLWSPVFSYIGARMIGITGSPYGSSFPFVKEASFLLSGYKGVAVWFAPIPIFEHGKVAETFKQLDLTKTTFGSVVKLTAVTTILMFVCSFIFYSLVWKLNPIPSAAYPFVQKMWPLNAAMRTIWVKSTLPGGITFIFDIIKIEYIIAGLGVTGGLFGLLTLVGASPLFFYGLVGGLAMPLWQTLPTFFGAILGRYYFSKRFGEEKWMAYVPIVLAGYGAGIGLIGMIAISIALISKAISQIVY